MSGPVAAVAGGGAAEAGTAVAGSCGVIYSGMDVSLITFKLPTCFLHTT